MADGKTFGLSTIGHLFQAPPGLAFFDAGGVRLIHGATAALKGRGVMIVDEPHIIAKMDTYDLWMAFFRDSEGNMHGLMSEVSRR